MTPPCPLCHTPTAKRAVRSDQLVTPDNASFICGNPHCPIRTFAGPDPTKTMYPPLPSDTKHNATLNSPALPPGVTELMYRHEARLDQLERRVGELENHDTMQVIAITKLQAQVAELERWKHQPHYGERVRDEARRTPGQ